MTSALFEDTIAAVATPAGRGALALLRLSGSAALDVLRRVAPETGAAPEPRRQRLLALRHPVTGELLDRGLVSYFPAPRSYTGEEMVELSTHGGALTPQLVLDALLAAGARAAEPGEFTRRALFHGKIDLLQAEAVADLIDGRSQALHRAAVSQMERGLSRRVEALRASVLRAEALVAYGIDFPEEDEPPVPPARIAEAVGEAARRIDVLLSTASQGELLREGALVVLAGRPNSGKSSLFNALLGAERAIVTEVPGTTRDALEAVLSLDGYPFRLVDTAGLRSTTDRVEEIGIEVARRYLRAAHVVLFCAEAGRPLEAEEQRFLREHGDRPTLLLRTKSDAAPAHDEASGDELHLSALEGTGLDTLRARLLGLAFGGILGEPGEAPLVTRARHARALAAAAGSLRRFLAEFQAAVPVELAATHLRDAAGSLEELIGAVTPDDVLGEVFGAFCVGK